MPNTLIPIQTVTVGSGGSSSIDFTNIPQNYTDLCLKYSLRSTRSAAVEDIIFDINGSTSNFSVRRLISDASTVTSATYSSGMFAFATAANNTAGTFGNGELYIPNYASANYKSISSDSITENNATAAYMFMAAALWSQTATINRITIRSDSASTIVQNSTATLYGVSNGVKATGGTLTVAGGYAYHTFTSTGSFLPSQQIKGAEVLVVAGGGGGGGELSSNAGAGGGGAGGLLYLNSQTLNAGNSYTAVVGSGGAGGAAGENNGNAGSNSVFSSITSTGGGLGAKRNVNGGNGGSGGGGGLSASSGGTGTVGQGNNGGGGSGTSSGGGGGGAGAAGSNAPANTTGGNAGIGSNSLSTWHSITGTGVLSGGVYYIAGGGGGGGVTFGTGGLGGGGNGGSNSNGVAGTANTGGGGGGGYDQSSAGRSGGAGGSGIVIVRYPLS